MSKHSEQQDRVMALARVIERHLGKMPDFDDDGFKKRLKLFNADTMDLWDLASLPCKLISNESELNGAPYEGAHRIVTPSYSADINAVKDYLPVAMKTCKSLAAAVFQAINTIPKQITDNCEKYRIFAPQWYVDTENHPVIKAFYWITYIKLTDPAVIAEEAAC